MAQQVLFINDGTASLHTAYQALISRDIDVHLAHNLKEAESIFSTYKIQVVVFGAINGKANWRQIAGHLRDISPSSYRMLMANDLDYQHVHAARQEGLLHKFVVSPVLPNSLLRDIQEGARQASLLHKLIRLKTSIKPDMCTLLTDRNWVIRLANDSICELLGETESNLVGRNLFSNQISQMPVALETELTRQVEAGHSWLGYFSLHAHNGQPCAMWAAISSVSRDYCICVFEAATDHHPGRDYSDWLAMKDQYQQFEQLDSFLASSAGMSCLQVVRFDEQPLQKDDNGFACYKAMVECIGNRQPLFQLANHLFVLPLMATDHRQCPDDHKRSIKQRFQSPLISAGDAITLTPEMRCLPLHEEHQRDPLDTLREMLDSPISRSRALVAQETSEQPAVTSSQQAFNDYRARPVFNKLGGLSGLELLPEYIQDPEVCHLWLENMQHTWQQHIQELPNIFVRLDSINNPVWMAMRQCISQWQQTGQSPLWQLILPWQADMAQLERTSLMLPEGIGLIIEVAGLPGAPLPVLRQLARCDIDGISIAANEINRWRASGDADYSIFQPLLEQGKRIYCHGIESTEALATAHQSSSIWLEGNALSRPIGAQQIHWFASH